jgi:hypothetical protein
MEGRATLTIVTSMDTRRRERQHVARITYRLARGVASTGRLFT